MASLVIIYVLCKIIDMDRIYKIKKALKAPMILAMLISIPIFVDVINSGFATRMLVMAILLMVLFYLFTINNLIKQVTIADQEIVIRSLFGSSRIKVEDIINIDGMTMGSRQFISISAKKRSYLIPNSFDDFTGLIDSLKDMVPEEAIGEKLLQLRGNVVTRKSDIAMGWITVILLMLIIVMRFFPALMRSVPK
jgi:hypothetical protein